MQHLTRKVTLVVGPNKVIQLTARFEGAPACAAHQTSSCFTSQVYEATTKGLIDKVIDGFNSTVFAYGQTSSGKVGLSPSFLQYS